MYFTTNRTTRGPRGHLATQVSFLTLIFTLILCVVSSAPAAGTPAGTSITNQATVTFVRTDGSSESVPSNSVTTVVQSLCSLSILPNGSAASPGQRATAAPGGAVYLVYGLTNTGNAANTYDLRIDVEGESTLEPKRTQLFLDGNRNGTKDDADVAVTRLEALAPDETVTLFAEVEPARGSGEIFINLVGACAGSAGSIESVDADNVAQVTVPLTGFSTPEKTSQPPAETPLYPGAEVRYEISFRVVGTALAGAVVTDVLDSDLDAPVSYTDGSVTDPETGLRADVAASFEGATLTWRFGALPAGMTVRLEVTTSVRADADANAIIENRACVAADLHDEACSTTLRHTLGSPELFLEKTATPARVSVGDTLSYSLLARNPSAEVPLTNLELSDNLPEGVTYAEGSSRLIEPDGTETRLEPEREPTGGTETLRWTLAALEPLEEATVRFEVRVDGGALTKNDLTNRAALTANGLRGETLMERGDTVVTPVEAGIFRTRAVLMGRAFVDVDGNRRFDEATDTPVEGLRLYLSNGLSTITDVKGRYTFPDLGPGLTTLRVDTTTAPPLLLLPTRNEDKPGLWRVRLAPGLITQQDVPFAPDEAAGVPAPDVSAVSAPDASPAAPDDTEATYEGAVILSPEDGLALRTRDAITVTVDTPLSDEVTLSVNGAPVAADTLGTRRYDEGRGRQTFSFVGVRLAAGPNEVVLESRAPTGELLEDEVTVFLAGSPAETVITPVGDLVADAATPLLFDVEVTDAWGKAPMDGFVTLEFAGALPAIMDADPQAVGYQLRYTDGVGRLALLSPPVPGDLSITAVLGREPLVTRFVIGSGLRPWIASGSGSAGLTLTPGEGAHFGLQTSFFVRGTVFDDYLLTVAADSTVDSTVGGERGQLGLVGNPYERFPITGSSGPLTSDATSRDGLFLRLERDLSYLQYGDFVTVLDGAFLDLARPYTGLSGAYVAGGLTARGYLAYENLANFVELILPSDGTSLYRLPRAPVEPGSLTVRVVKRDPFDNSVLDETEAGVDDALLGYLTPLIDYTLDEVTGVLQLARPLPLADLNGYPYVLVLSYRVLDEAGAPRALQFGVGVAYDLGGVVVRVGAYEEGRAGASPVRVASAGVVAGTDTLRGDAEVAYGRKGSEGGVGASAGVRFERGPVAAEGRYRYQGEGYRSATVQTETDGERAAGHFLQADVAFAVSPEVAVALSGAFGRGSAGLSYNGTLYGAYSGRGALFLGGARLGEKPSVGFGLGVQNGTLQLVGSLGLRDLAGLAGTEVAITHRQGLAGDASSTDFSVAYQISGSLALRLTDRLVWGEGNALFLGLESGFETNDLLSAVCQIGVCRRPDPTTDLGTTTVTAQYELAGGVSGEAGRVRVGVSSLYPVNDRLSIEGSIDQTLEFGGDENGGGEDTTVLSLGATYNERDYNADARYELRFGEGVKHVLTSSAVFALNEDLFGSMTLDYLSESRGEGADQGFRLGLAAAYRGENLSILANHTGAFGSLAPEGVASLEGDSRLTVPVGDAWALQGGYLYRYKGGFSQMFILGASAYPWRGGGVSGFGHLYHDVTAGDVGLGATLEVSQKLGCGLYGVGGYTAGEGLAAPTAALSAKPGFSLRLDFAFDEEWSCGGGSIGDRVFLDSNADGVQGESEAGVGDVTVTLYMVPHGKSVNGQDLDSNAQRVATTRTDARGRYQFRRLEPGAYFLEFNPPAGYRFSPYGRGDDAARDADVDPHTARTGLYRLEAGAATEAVDAGLVREGAE